ncbi:hypothetical protein GKQ23_01690 [Erwinia sp. E602]|uniref:hypothetical protein n=1 Tax=Erwinia sp. E602 TaxID=2675378 RepID=UPI001BA7E130|nr:hypothetical protein [Erwinia sp. E602]QUG73793.1 hypothetical protein GKQ23_01690 [Erwinia sp. E602]
MNRDHPLATGRPAARPARAFIAQLVTFVINPAIRNGRDEAAPLRDAAWNFIASVCLVALLTGGLGALLNASDISGFSGAIRPGFLTLLLAAYALIFAMLFWLLTTAVISVRKRGLHLLSFMQVLQSWAALNLFVVLLCWAALDRLLVASDDKPLSLVYLALGGVAGLALLILAARLLLLPVIRYMSRYLNLPAAAVMTLAIACVSIYLSAQLIRPFSAVAFDAQATCQALNLSRNAPGTPGQMPEKMFTDSCLAQFR